MAFWSNWPDGTKWLMGIVGALIVAFLIARFNPPGNGAPEPSPTPVDPATTVTPATTPTPAPSVIPPTPPPVKIAAKSTGREPTKEPAPAIQPETSPSPATIDLGNRRQTAQGYEFLLDRCAVEGEHLNCWLRVTNIAGQGRLSIFRDGSWLKGQDDKKHKVWRVLGSNGEPEFNILQLKDLPKNSPEVFGLHFEDLNGSVNSVKYLNLKTRDFSIGWRDVEVE